MGGRGLRGGGVFSPCSSSSASICSREAVGCAMSGNCGPRALTSRVPDFRLSGLVVGALSNSVSTAGVGVGSPALRGVRPGKAGPFFGDGTTDNLGTERGLRCGASAPKAGRGVSAAESGKTDCGDRAPDPAVGDGSFGSEPVIPGTDWEPEIRGRARSGPEPPAGAGLGPDPGTGGGALGPDPGIGGGAALAPDPGTGGGLGPDPGIVDDSLRPEPGCGSFGPEPRPPAGGGFGLTPGA
jgi:hypothetical protein